MFKWNDLRFEHLMAIVSNILRKWIFSSSVIGSRKYVMWRGNSCKEKHGNCMRSQKSSYTPNSVCRQISLYSLAQSGHFFSSTDWKTFSFVMLNITSLDQRKQTCRALTRSWMKSREKMFKSNSFGRVLIWTEVVQSIDWLIFLWTFWIWKCNEQFE